MNPTESRATDPSIDSVTRRSFFKQSMLGAAGLTAATGTLSGCAGAAAPQSPDGLHAATFEVDATPPVGYPLSGGNDVAKEIVDPLSCRGVVMMPDNQLPIVLAAVDWINNSNGGYDAWRLMLAEAVGTSPDRVAMHALHQHDAPSCDFDEELILLGHGLEPGGFSPTFARETIRSAAEALRTAAADPQPVTHVGLGRAKVEKFASNRRLLGMDGNVQYWRMSNTEGSPELRTLPEGQIDPLVRVVSLWNQDEPLAALSYYATHPQSYYGEGGVSCDTTGIGRNMRQEATGIPHIHFNGAGGNIAAGKYNDRSKENRQILAGRLADGLERAWSETEKISISSADIGWITVPTHLPAEVRNDEGETFTEEELIEQFVADPGDGTGDLAWMHRSNAGHKIPLTCLKIADARVLHMPGELHIEYQLAAAAMRPDAFVAMAAYGDGGPGYIATRASYPKGAYEVGSPSDVSPDVEDALTAGMRELLDIPENEEVKTPSDFTREKERFSF